MYNRLMLGLLLLGLVFSAFAVPAFSQDSSLRQSADASAAAPSDMARVSAPNPGVAITLAMMPGVAVHGAGHFYAERPLTGAALLAVELGSLYLLYRGGTGIYNATNSGVLDGTSANFGESEEFSRGAGLAVAGLTIFIASWLYDLTGAPIAASETLAAKTRAVNRNLTVKPEVRADRAGVVFEHRF